MKSFALLDSSEAEEIIKLRVELAKTKAKLSKYEDAQAKVDLFEAITQKLADQFNSRQPLIKDICKMAGLQIQPLRLSSLEMNSRCSRDLGQHLQQLIFRQEELLKTQEGEQAVLECVSKQIAEIIKQHKSLKDSQRQLQKQHSGCGVKIAVVQQQAQSSRALELAIRQKQAELCELARSKEQLQEQAERSMRRCDQLQSRLSQLQGELEEKGRTILAHQQRQSQGQTILAERQQVLERCTNLIGNLKIRQQEYLTHYFRSNGVPLDLQRPYKNKYEMVFD